MCDTDKLGEVYKMLNPEDNGGETVAINIDIFDNGDYDANSIFTVGTVSLQSYGNFACITLGNVTPEFLRELANELQSAICVAAAETKKVAND